MALAKLFLVAFSLMAVMVVSQAIQCYQCEGSPFEDCAKAVLSSMQLVTCEGPSVCHYTDTRSGSERSVSRGCTTIGPKDLCTTLYELSAQFPMGLKVFACSTCSNDKCNIQTTR
ncbi:hypothetical protein FQA39_LY10629 [Lamprigera yunnana]|nr:hypothetical protein FQA39_LY10629 [Lamprigera yunnana]